MDKLKKFLECEIKAAEGEPSTYYFTASTEDRDREGDVIVQSGWKLKAFKQNPVILWAHNSTEPPIGKATETSIEEGKLRLKVQFASDHYPFAAMIENMVKDGFIRTMSVGFTVWKQEDLTADDMKERPGIPYGRRLYGELLEVSVVPVPANPMALADRGFGELVARSFGDGSRLEEKESPLLNYKGDGGSVDPQKMKAAFGALFGARGGVAVPDTEKKAVYNHLARVSKEAGIDVPEFRVYTPEELRTGYEDVWHEELLEMVTTAMSEEERSVVHVLRGARRTAIQRVVEDLSKLLAATEDDIPEDVIDPETDLKASIEALGKGLAVINARMK